MAGKNPPIWNNNLSYSDTASKNAAMATEPPSYPCDRLNMAYSEGRQRQSLTPDVPALADNPHDPIAAPLENVAWGAGALEYFASNTVFAGTQYQTCTVDKT